MNKDRKDRLKQIANEKRERVSANRNFWRCINLDLGLSEDAYDRIAVIFQTCVFFYYNSDWSDLSHINFGYFRKSWGLVTLVAI